MTLPRVARLLPVELPLFSMNVPWEAISNSAGEAELQFFEPRCAHFLGASRAMGGSVIFLQAALL